jgi:hypothetical protein
VHEVSTTRQGVAAVVVNAEGDVVVRGAVVATGAVVVVDGALV